jgi:hypothetical protein
LYTACGGGYPTECVVTESQLVWIRVPEFRNRQAVDVDLREIAASRSGPMGQQNEVLASKGGAPVSIKGSS